MRHRRGGRRPFGNLPTEALYGSHMIPARSPNGRAGGCYRRWSPAERRVSVRHPVAHAQGLYKARQHGIPSLTPSHKSPRREPGDRQRGIGFSEESAYPSRPLPVFKFWLISIRSVSLLRAHGDGPWSFAGPAIVNTIDGRWWHIIAESIKKYCRPGRHRWRC